MSLNRRTGLYSMPSHHLHGTKPAPRPSFNSMDFSNEESSSPSSGKQSMQQVKEKNTAPQERKDDKKKRKQSLSFDKQLLDNQLLDNRTPSAPTPLIQVTPATASSKGKKDKNVTKSDNKRKHVSEGHFDPAPMLPKLSNNGGFVVGTDMLKNVQSSVKAAGEVFGSSTAAVATAEGPSKKKPKKDKVGRKSGDIIDFDRMAKETRSIDRRAKKEAKAKRLSAEAANTRETVPVPSPPIFSSPPPRKTPVPLPQNAFSRTVNASKAEKGGRRDSRLLALNTPPSQLPKTPVMLPDSPIPFKLPNSSKKKGHKSSEKVAGPSDTLPLVAEASSSAPPAVNNSHPLELKSGGQVSLTTSNLMKYSTSTQPLSDGAKAKPKAVSRAASTAGSTTSGGTTRSIKDLLARVGKPYSRSGAEVDPFVVPEPKKKIILETHEEASVLAFTSRFHAAQQAVNFSDERDYLDQATVWRTTNSSLGPLPCLGQKASGCNTKRETILRLTQDDPSSHLTVQVCSPADTAALLSAKERATAAESFLAMALAARVPVPLGPLQGTWQLFCPAYSDSHVDKYGYGQRTLRIFSTPGTADTFTARLSIPPRSMLYALRPFTVPPHASFRATTLRTTAEGYKLDVVFLGNGYALLRVDLQLLLSGKEGGVEGRSTVMEFLGVHEGAVVWREEVDELEEVGRKLFAKYDGEA
ncbi:hypothetical protein SVAN01_06107 [Stagonosporopsis vannaccii]|nr:hypothetical protein SVAN01_06107 [Stagonosporopsis vannaccii]